LNFAFNTAQIIWTLTFAAQLVLLVVLLGRDRAKLYPIFTLATIAVTFRWLASRLLFQRLSPVAGNTVYLGLAVLVALANLAMLISLAHIAFKGAERKQRTIGTAVVGALAVAVVVLWGPWPAWTTFTGGGLIVSLRLMQLLAQRSDMLTGALAVQLAILAAVVGPRVGAGWRNRAQRLMMGVGVVGACQLTISGIWQYLATHTIPHNQDEYFRLLAVRDRLNNANSVVYILVLIFWIACLWADEPSSAPVAATETAALPATTEATEDKTTPDQPNS